MLLVRLLAPPRLPLTMPLMTVIFHMFNVMYSTRTLFFNIVLKTLMEREQKLNDSVLSVHQHYQFMKTITETRNKRVNINSDVFDHAIKKCEKEIRDRFGAETLQIFKEKEELIFPNEIAEQIEEYMEQFIVKEIPFCTKLLNTSREELNVMITAVKKENITATMEEELPQMKIVGTKKCANENL